MKFHCSFWRLGLAGFMSVLFVGCQTGTTQAPKRSVEGQAEQSVRPGINDSYLAADLDVGQWVERFEREGREVYDKRRQIIEAAQVKPGADVADIGAGSGLFTLLLAQETGEEGLVYAVDIVKDFLAHIDRRASEAGLENVITVLATERSVELPAESIDLAFISDAYHHFEYPQSTLASIHDALRPQGELVVVEFERIPGQSSDWALNHVRAGQEVFTEEIEAAGFEQIEEVDLLEDNYYLRFRKLNR